MASINDWAAKAAEYIKDEPRSVTKERLAAIIATFAEPLVAVLREAYREHYHCDDSWYCCGACTHPCDDEEMDHEHDESCCVGSHKGEAARVQGVCNCGADAFNAKIDAALAGKG